MSTTATKVGNPDFCQRMVYGDRDVLGHLCLRPVKEGDLCGMHAAADRRIRENDRKRAEARVAKEGQRDRITAELSELGVSGYPEYLGYPAMKYTGRVVLTLEELRRLVAEGKGGER